MIRNCNLAVKDCSIGKYQFFTDILKSWCEHNYHTPMGKAEVLQQTIWYNSHIKVNNKLLVATKADMTLVSKLDNFYENDKWKEFEVFKRCNPTIKINFLNYLTMEKAIPREWNRLLKISNPARKTLTKLLKNKIPSCSAQAFRIFEQRNKNPSHYCRYKWEQELQNEILDTVWSKIIINIDKLTLSSNLRAFQYRLVNRAIVTNIHLYKWKIKTSENCDFCANDREKYTHLFYDCPVVQKKIWLPMRKWLSYFCNINLDVDAYQVIFNMYKDSFASMVNTIILIIKHFIYQKKCLQENLHFQQLIEIVTQTKMLEAIVAKKKRMLEKHHKKWLMYDKV